MSHDQAKVIVLHSKYNASVVHSVIRDSFIPPSQGPRDIQGRDKHRRRVAGKFGTRKITLKFL